MISTQVQLSEDTKEALQALAEERGTSQSALIREALESFLEGTENADELNGPDEDETLENLRAARGIWKGRENVHEEFREIRESMDRDVWGRTENRDQENDE
ncbi:MAG: CopG family transcriptional regulator [Salinibacter sp.]